RSGGGSRRKALACLPARHAAAVDAGHHRRLAAGVHPCGGRVRDPRHPGRARRADHRPRAVDRVLHQPRLAAGGRGHHRHAAADRVADAGVRVFREPARGTGGAGVKRRPFLLYTAMVLGYAFLYIPILSVVVYSFNASRVATVWGGFSTRWYSALLA